MALLASKYVALKIELHVEFDTKMGCRDGIRGNELLQMQNLPGASTRGSLHKMTILVSCSPVPSPMRVPSKKVLTRMSLPPIL